MALFVYTAINLNESVELITVFTLTLWQFRVIIFHIAQKIFVTQEGANI